MKKDPVGKDINVYKSDKVFDSKNIIEVMDNAVTSVFEVIKEKKLTNTKNVINQILSSKLMNESEINTQMHLAAVDIIIF